MVVSCHDMTVSCLEMIVSWHDTKFFVTLENHFIERWKYTNINLVIWNKNLNFAEYSSAESLSGSMREGAKLLYGKSVYLKLLFLTRPNFATYDHSSKNETTVDAHGRYIHTLPRIVVYIPEEYPYGIYTYFRVWVNICHAWAFCSCPFRRIGGNAKAWTRGTDDGQVPRLNQYVFYKHL